MKTVEEMNRLSGIVVDAAMEVHRAFGPGLLERVYEAALAKELQTRGVSCERQVPVPVLYKGETLDDEGYRIDLLVEGCLVVELKTVAELLPIHEAQLHTYLKLSGNSLGLILNFNVLRMKEGIRRRVLNFPESSRIQHSH